MTGPDPPVLSNVTDDLSWGRIAGCFAEPDDGLAADSCRKAACRKAGLASPSKLPVVLPVIASHQAQACDQVPFPRGKGRRRRAMKDISCSRPILLKSSGQAAR